MDSVFGEMNTQRLLLMMITWTLFLVKLYNIQDVSDVCSVECNDCSDWLCCTDFELTDDWLR